ncbi:histidine phosphatase family protein [Oceanobacter sp. 3_MG-2023]|jgi:phosphohistidine phosphatase SixA|uniref:histidine phosphatase family protein n=1 Tax=Oceanobacter sp. 3_MG-2023 TaxID=3062622 RepID=UPI0027330299|nr:histidine phosphatase family protein [Oceanobacter sp. 3_MG-2023]MDP2504241.1 histidine phosphatase family protein [Oceanobacter sp. 3_MG-2023]
MTFLNRLYCISPRQHLNLSTPQVAILVLVLLFCLPLKLQAEPSLSPDQLWQQLQQPGYLLMMRSARAPGFGDPANFDLTDCSTQRNLSNEGKDHARRIGDALRQHHITDVQLYSSHWCRTQETARLLDLGTPTPLAALDKRPHSHDAQSSQPDALEQWIQQQPLTTPVLLVTHQANITAMTGIHTRSGDLVVIRKNSNGSLVVAGKLYIH